MPGLRMLGLAAALLGSGTASAATLLNAYDFNGTSVTDSVGGIDGTLFGNASVSGGTLNLDGYGDYAELGGKIIPDSGPFSLYFRYAASESQTNYYVEIVSQGYSGQPGFYVGFIGTDTRLTDNYSGGIGYTLPADTLFHDLLLTTGAGNTDVYIDGTAIFSAAGNVNPGNLLGTNTRFGTQFGGYAEDFQGKLDQVRLFSGIATYAEASASANASPTPEPASWAMMIGGFGMIGATLRRARKPALA